jgi:hypothetical protein
MFRVSPTLGGDLALQLNCSVSRWGQVYILDSLLSFTPQTSAEAEQLGERLSIRLQHANSAVVLTTIKLLLYLMNYMEDESFIASLERKMGPPLGKSLMRSLQRRFPGLRQYRSDYAILGSRGPIRRFAEHPLDHPTETCDFATRGQGLLLQVQ